MPFARTSIRAPSPASSPWATAPPSTSSTAGSTPEADVWLSLATSFTTHTGRDKVLPSPGIDLEEFCHERFLRCLHADLSPWTGTDLLTRTSTTFCSDPLPTSLTITFDPATSALSHNLENVIDDTAPTDIIDSCASLD